MKKRRFALVIVIFTLICCIGITGFAEEGEEAPSDVFEQEPEEEPVVPTGGETTEEEIPEEETPGEETPEEPVIPEEPVVPVAPALELPYITKDPGAETVKSGEGCIFIAKAENYTNINWYFTKNGQIVYAANAAQQFPGLRISGDGTEIFSLESVPESLDGWNVGAVFSNAVGQQGTATCTITVTAPASPSPKATPSPKPTVSPTPRPAVTLPPTATPAATATPSVSPTPEVKPEETESKGFPFALLLIAIFAVLFLGGAAALFVLYRNGRLGSDKTSDKPARASRYNDYDDDDDDEDDDSDDNNNISTYRGKH